MLFPIGYTYTADGNLAGKTERNGILTTNAYDIHGRLVSENVGGDTVSNTYDNNGNQLTMSDNTGITARVYDELGRVKSKTVPKIGTTTFKVDRNGRTTYTYDALNRLLTTTEPSGKVTAFTYDAAGNRASQTVSVGEQAVRTDYTYKAECRKV